MSSCQITSSKSNLFTRFFTHLKLTYREVFQFLEKKLVIKVDHSTIKLYTNYSDFSMAFSKIRRHIGPSGINDFIIVNINLNIKQLKVTKL